MRFSKLLWACIFSFYFVIPNLASAQAPPAAAPPNLAADQDTLAKAQSEFDQANAQFLKEGQSGQPPSADESTNLKKLSDALAQAKKNVTDDAATIVAGGNTAASNTNCLFKRNTQNSFCFVTGPIIIPFRAELSGNKDILGGFNAGVFLGLNAGNWLSNNNIINPGFLSNLTLITFVSYSPSFNSTNGAVGGTSTNGSGVLNIGAGIAVPIQWNTGLNTSLTNHIGLVWGMDVTSTSNKYAYNGKSWISVVTGWSF